MKIKLPINRDTRISNFDVVIAYDSVRYAKLTKELSHRLERSLGLGSELNLIFWNFSALNFPQLAQAAFNEACHASLLIVVVDGDERLPSAVERFLTRCAHSLHVAHGALVAQLHGILKMNEDLSPAYCLLQRIAQETDLPFFSEVITSTDEELDYSLDAIHERADMRTPVLEAKIEASDLQPA